MKLRSGKVLPTRHSALPPVLEEELETRLQEFKTLISGNKQHAKELLNIITKYICMDDRMLIREKIEEVYDINLLETHSLMRASGYLARLLFGNSSFYREHYIEPEYHDLIQARMKGFELETPLLGSDEISMGEL
jgi:hypothetical protein